MLQSAGGAATSPLFMVAAKAISSSRFSLIMIDHANNEIDGGYVEQRFSTTAAQPAGLEDAAVTSSATIISDLNLASGTTLGAAWTTAASQSVAAVTAATTLNIRLYNRLAGTTFTATEAAAQTPATTTTVLSSTTLEPDSMITYTCASTAADTGKVATFTDGAATAKTFTLTCKNAGSAAVEVNWNTLSADNDVFTAQPAPPSPSPPPLARPLPSACSPLRMAAPLPLRAQSVVVIGSPSGWKSPSASPGSRSCTSSCFQVRLMFSLEISIMATSLRCTSSSRR